VWSEWSESRRLDLSHLYLHVPSELERLDGVPFKRLPRVEVLVLVGPSGVLSEIQKSYLKKLRRPLHVVIADTPEAHERRVSDGSLDAFHRALSPFPEHIEIMGSRWSNARIPYVGP